MGNTSANGAFSTEFVNRLQPFLARGYQLSVEILLHPPFEENSFLGGWNSTTAPQAMNIDSGFQMVSSGTTGSMAQHHKQSPRNELQVDLQKQPSLSGDNPLPLPLALLLLQKARNSQARMTLDLSAMLNATAHQIRHLQSITETITASMNAMVTSRALANGVRLHDLLVGDPQEGLVYVEDIVAARRDLATLAPNTWLNEHVVNAYVMSLPRVHNKSDVVVVPSFSFAVLEKDPKLYVQMHYARIQDKLVRASKILVPINISNSHWVLGVIRIASHEVRCEIHDSLSSNLKLQMV